MIFLIIVLNSRELILISSFLNSSDYADSFFRIYALVSRCVYGRYSAAQQLLWPLYWLRSYMMSCLYDVFKYVNMQNLLHTSCSFSKTKTRHITCCLFVSQSFHFSKDGSYNMCKQQTCFNWVCWLELMESEITLKPPSTSFSGILAFYKSPLSLKDFMVIFHGL